MERIKIISEPTENQDFFVIYKPKGLPSAPLSLDDKNNALSQLIEINPELMSVKGKKDIEYGLMHRIDTQTDGLLIVAINQKSYENLQNLQKEGKIIKYYRAICNCDSENPKILEGFGKNNIFPLKTQEIVKIESYFRPFGPGRKEVRPVTEQDGKAALKKIEKKVLYTTNIQLIEEDKNKVTFDCSIKNGYRHQVRCHLAWIGYPIIGDEIYNRTKTSEQLNFRAYKINIDGKIFEISCN